MDGMEGLTDAFGPIGLVILALVDSTSVGTLVIPLMLLAVGRGGARRVAGRTVLYLLVIGVFYLLLGVALLAGLLPLIERAGHLLEHPVVPVVGAVIGVGLIVWSFRVDPKAIEKRGGDPMASATRWSDRVRDAAGSTRALVVLALAAGVVEAASMVPYLVAMGLIADMGVSLGGGALILVGYCAVMIAPALVLVGIRVVAGSRGDAVLEKVHGWAVKNAAGAFSWALAIIGVIILLNTLQPALNVLGANG